MRYWNCTIFKPIYREKSRKWFCPITGHGRILGDVTSRSVGEANPLVAFRKLPHFSLTQFVHWLKCKFKYLPILNILER